MIEVEFVEDLDAWRRGVPGSTIQVDQDALTKEPWVFASSASTQRVFDDLYDHISRRILDVADIFVGVQTSADDIFFVVPEDGSTDTEVAFTDKNDRRWRIEREATKPALVDRSLSPYEAQPVPDRFAVWPYDIEERGSGRLRAKVVTPDELRRRFPRALEYLEHHRAALEDRSVSPDPGESFYAYGRSQSLTKMEDPKIIVRGVSVPLAPQYVWDPNGHIVPGGGTGPYTLMRSTDKDYPQEVLVALMSHPVIDALVIAGARVFRGGYAVHAKQSLKPIPVPDIDNETRERLIEFVGEMQRLSVGLRDENDSMRRAAIESRRTYLRGKVEEAVSATLGLSDEDLQHFVA